MEAINRPTFEECLELIREGPDKGSISSGLAGDFNVVYPKDYNGAVPLSDHVPITLLFGVPFPADYAKNVIEPLAMPQLMNEFVKGYLTECKHCGELPCYILMEDVKEDFKQMDAILMSKLNMSWVDDDDTEEGPLPSRSEALKLVDAEDLKAARFKMYKKFSWIINGTLGKGKRVPLPECVANKIKSLWPDPKDEYVGFRAAPVDDNGHN